MLRRWTTTLLMITAVIAANALALALVLGRGLDFMLGPLGALLQVPLVLGLGVAARWILGPRAAGWFAPSRAAVVELGAGLLLGTLAVAAIAGLVAIVSAPSGAPAFSPAALASFTVNAALQQVGLAGVALAASDPRRGLGPDGVAFAVAFFTVTHAQESTAPLYLLNVALFALATLGVTAARRRLALAAGLHGGWNAALFFVGGVPLEGSTPAVSWAHTEAAWSGGAAGFEHGLANAAVVAAIAATAWASARAQRSQ